MQFALRNRKKRGVNTMKSKLLYVLLSIGMITGCSASKGNSHNVVFQDDIQIEYGENVNSAKFVKRVDTYVVNDSMIEGDKIHVSNFTVSCPNIKKSTNELGELSLVYTIGEEEYTTNVTVVDTTPPVITLENNDFVFEVNEMKDMNEYFSVSDNYDKEKDIQIEIEGDLNINKVGLYDVKIVATDSSKNTSSQSIKIKINDTKKEKEEKRKQEEQNRQQSNNQVNNEYSGGASYVAPVNPSITSRDYLFSDGYDMSSAPSACQADLIASGMAGSCIPIQDENGIYLGMRLVIG